MGAICARVVHLQTSQHDWLLRRARAQQQQVDAGGVARGLILDRAGRELARSVEVDSFFAVPGEMEDTDAAARSLAAALGLDRAELAERLRQGKEAGRQFV